MNDCEQPIDPPDHGPSYIDELTELQAECVASELWDDEDEPWRLHYSDPFVVIETLIDRDPCIEAHAEKLAHDCIQLDRQLRYADQRMRQIAAADGLRDALTDIAEVPALMRRQAE